MDEEQIITLFFARSEQAIEALDAKYGKLFHSLSYHIVNDRQDADECVNDAYLGAWNAIPRQNRTLLPYMARIVRNISLKCYWKKGRCQAKQSLHPCFAGSRGVSSRPKERRGRGGGKGPRHCVLFWIRREPRVIFMRRYWFSDSCRDIAGACRAERKISPSG